MPCVNAGVRAGAPAAHEVAYAHFENPREYRRCDVSAFVDAAQQVRERESEREREKE